MKDKTKFTLSGFGALAGALSLGSAGASYLVMRELAGGRRQTYDEAFKWQREHSDFSWFSEEDLRQYTITAPDGYVLHAAYLPAREQSDRFMILTHGYTDNMYGSLKYARLYLDLGFHLVVYDLRGHGENEPHFCSYTIFESQDLLAVIEDTKERFHPALIGLHGESLGASTTVAALGKLQDQCKESGEQPAAEESNAKIAFAVSDCGFADFEMLTRYLMKRRSLPESVARGASAMMKLRYGHSFSEMRPVLSLRSNHIPVLFFHGSEDTLIPPVHSSIMHRENAGYSEFHIIPGAKHAASILTDRQRYEKYVSAFVKTVLKES